jgi:hypothetical protein
MASLYRSGWLLPVYRYLGAADLADALGTKLIDDAEAMADDIATVRSIVAAL